MSLVQMSELQEKQRREAKQKFIELAWTDTPDTGELLKLSEQANMTPAKADEILERIELGKRDLKICNGLPRLRQKHDESLNAYHQIMSEQEPVISAAKAKIEAAGQAVQAIQSKIDNDEQSTDRLMKMLRDGEMPESMIPKEILRIRKLESAELEKLDTHKRWVEARNRVAKLKSDIHEAEIQNHTKGFDYTDELQYYNQKLPIAENELKAAADAARKAGFDIPVEATK